MRASTTLHLPRASLGYIYNLQRPLPTPYLICPLLPRLAQYAQAVIGTMPSYLLERDVLKPKDPRIKDNNDWEIFLLSNAEVRDATTGELSSLLNAHAASPVTVTGRLQAVKSEQQRLRRQIPPLSLSDKIGLLIYVKLYSVAIGVCTVNASSNR